MNQRGAEDHLQRSIIDRVLPLRFCHTHLKHARLSHFDMAVSNIRLTSPSGHLQTSNSLPAVLHPSFKAIATWNAARPLPMKARGDLTTGRMLVPVPKTRTVLTCCQLLMRTGKMLVQHPGNVLRTIRTDLVCQRLQQLCAKTAGGGHLVHLNKKGLTFILTPLLTIVHERMIGGAMSEEQHPRTITSPDLALRPCRLIRTRKMGGDHSMPT